MKLKLTRAARIRHEAGEIVEVSPAEAGFLLSTGSAVHAPIEKITDLPDEKMFVTPEEGTQAPETPEAKAEAPEKPEDAAKKETRTEAEPKKTTKKETKK